MESIKTLEELNNYIKDKVPFIVETVAYGYVGISWQNDIQIKSISSSYFIDDKYDLIDEIDKKYFKFYNNYIGEEKLIEEVLLLIGENQEIIDNINLKRDDLCDSRTKLFNSSLVEYCSNEYKKEDIYLNLIDVYLLNVIKQEYLLPRYYNKSKSFIFRKNEDIIFTLEIGTFSVSYDKFIKKLSIFLKLNTIDTLSVFIKYIKSLDGCYNIVIVDNSGKFEDYDYYLSDEYKKYHDIINLLHYCDKDENAYITKYSKNNKLLCIIEKSRIIISHDEFIKIIAKGMKIDIISAITLIKEYFKEIHKIDNDNFIIVDNNDKIENYVIDETLVENILNYDKKMSNHKNKIDEFDNIILKAIEDTNDRDEQNQKNIPNNTESSDFSEKFDNNMKVFISELFKEKDELLVDVVNIIDKEKMENDETKPIDNIIVINKNTENIEHYLSSRFIDTSDCKSETLIKSINEILLEDRISGLEKQIDANNKLLDTILNKISL